jgi:hypothetical protein
VQIEFRRFQFLMEFFKFCLIIRLKKFYAIHFSYITIEVPNFPARPVMTWTVIVRFYLCQVIDNLLRE